MATIKAIEARTVHQIQSGQVIVDLCSVVKELVENSVDAGATNIEVRFKNQGLDLIEVQDNGFGISPENYETLALKHYTSKLSTYEDLSNLETFGFRGEALSSLCALSKFSVITCLAADAPKGSRLEFETSGKLRSTSVVAAQKGTTVIVEGLFHNLPVRRRELERNIKREWNRVIAVLNQYACIQTGVKFSVSQQPNKGKKIVLFSTRGNRTTKENIVNVFGAKTLSVLIPLELDLELEPTSGPSHIRSKHDDGGIKEVRIRGHVSRPAHGEGRQTPDRQMFFVNGRPCGLPQFAKVFNEVYKSYNSSQSPFIFADIQLDTNMYDVNVSPDKRTILLHDQSRMLDNLRESLVALFEAQDYSVPVSQLGGAKHTPFKKPTISRQGTVESEGARSESSVNGISVVGTPQTGCTETPASEGGQEEEKDGSSLEDTIRNSNVSSRSIDQAGQGRNLISRWIEKKSSSRSESPSTGAFPITEQESGEISKSKERLIAKFALDDTEHRDHEAVENESGETPGRVAGRRMAEANDLKVAEAAIPSVSPSTRASGTKPDFFSPSRYKRSAPEVATITIGDETVTSVIGSSAKRPRTDRSREPRSMDRQKPPRAIPSFQGRLTQMFSASSTSKESQPAQLKLTTQSTDDREPSSPSSRSSEGLFVEEEQGEGASEVDDGDTHHDVEDDTNDGDDLSSASEDREAMDSSPLEQSHGGDDDPDGDYIDEAEKKAKEDDRVQDIIAAAADAAKASSEETQKRQQSFVKGGTKRKDTTRHLEQRVRLDEGRIRDAVCAYENNLVEQTPASSTAPPTDLDATDAEEKLSLTISKVDFGKMAIIGQFNLGFILAVRPACSSGSSPNPENHATDDELFIIDQHATDEKYNFERLQSTTTVQSQRLVTPKTLQLTALEEEILKEHLSVLEANGFQVSIDESGDLPVGSRCQLLSLPLSRETTFSLSDLEELISMLSEFHPTEGSSYVPRPSRVRKMFAMRACRSSVMIGKSLSQRQMERLVRHMGELDKPWNCPHGRPTMRHLSGLGIWGEMGWREGDTGLGEEGRRDRTDWSKYVRENRVKNGSGSGSESEI